MISTSSKRIIQSRQQLFDFLQSGMPTTHQVLTEKHRLAFESNQIKSYIFEADVPQSLDSTNRTEFKKFLSGLYSASPRQEIFLTVVEKEEGGLYELHARVDKHELVLYLDTSTNPGFWLGFSVSGSRALDSWFEKVIQSRSELDYVWLWPRFLEEIQLRGIARGFGLDYDYRRFSSDDSEHTTYLKMQLWGGQETAKLYPLLKNDPGFKAKIVLSKVRVKEFADSDEKLFALQDIKFNGKFTTRGTDFSTHLTTLNSVRADYERKILAIEDKYALRWHEREGGAVVLGGFAIYKPPALLTFNFEWRQIMG